MYGASQVQNISTSFYKFNCLCLFDKNGYWMFYDP